VHILSGLERSRRGVRGEPRSQTIASARPPFRCHRDVHCCRSAAGVAGSGYLGYEYPWMNTVAPSMRPI